MSLLKTYKTLDLVGDNFSWIVAGPPGTGKSTLLGDAAKGRKALLLATLSREVASWKYRQHNVDVIPLWESGWFATDVDGSLPKGLKVEGFTRVRQVLNDLLDDEEYEVILLDSGTELAELAWHDAMLPYGVIAPGYITDGKSRWLPYETRSCRPNRTHGSQKNAGSSKNFARCSGGSS